MRHPSPWRARGHMIVRTHVDLKLMAYAIILLGLALAVYHSGLALLAYLCVWAYATAVAVLSGSRQVFAVSPEASDEEIRHHVRALNEAEATDRGSLPRLIFDIASLGRESSAAPVSATSQVPEEPAPSDAPSVETIRGNVDHALLALRRQGFSGPTIKALERTRGFIGLLSDQERIDLNESCNVIETAAVRIVRASEDGLGNIGTLTQNLEHVVSSQGPKIVGLERRVSERRMDEAAVERIYLEQRDAQAPELEV